MCKRVMKLLCLMVSVFMLTAVVTSCQQQVQAPQPTQSATATPQATAKPEEDIPFWELLDKVSDSSELPDWNGKKLTLRVWRGHGTGDFIRYYAEDNVVAKEVERVTGVRIDLENSFDNAGQDWETKLGLLAATNEWPELGNDPANLQMLIDAGKVWDLTDLIPQYMPLFVKSIPDTKLYQDFFWKGRFVSGEDGRIYGVPEGGIRLVDLDYIDVDMERYNRIHKPRDFTDNWAYFWVRDDLLKKLYPNAMTLKEMEDYYEQHGQFSLEQIFDVPIRSREEFFQFLYDMKDLIDREDIREGNQKVYVSYAGTGGDAWGLMSIVDAILDGRWRTNYATYFNAKEQKIKFMMAEPHMRENMLDYVKLIWDGVLSKESLVDSTAITQEKVNNGLYAVSTVSWVGPNRQVIEEKGVEWRYRRLNLAIPPDPNYVMIGDGIGGGSAFYIFKDAVKEEDLPQILRWAEYCMSPIGQLNKYWGPRSAGLFEEDGQYRKYKDPELESNMVYNEDNEAGNRYGLATPFKDKNVNFMYPSLNSDFYSPRYMYPEVRRSRFEATDYFNPAAVSEEWNILNYLIDIPYSDAFWMYQSDITESMTKFNSVWTQFNELILKCLAATDEADFNRRFDEMLQFAFENGCDEAGMAEVNKVFWEKNAGYEDVLKGLQR